MKKPSFGMAFLCPDGLVLYILAYQQKKEGSYAAQPLSDHRDLCCCAWHWYFYCGYFSRRPFDVFGSIPADRVRDRMHEKMKGEWQMKVVIWKSPKALRGLLKRFFKI